MAQKRGLSSEAFTRDPCPLSVVTTRNRCRKSQLIAVLSGLFLRDQLLQLLAKFRMLIGHVLGFFLG